MLTFDANILFYAGDAGSPGKRARALGLLDSARAPGCAFLILQTLAEFVAAITRKRLLDRERAVVIAREWATTFDVASATASDFDQALSWFAIERHSLWDGLLIATAARCGATALVTEDFAAGSVIGGVEIINPFGQGAAARLRRHGLDA